MAIEDNSKILPDDTPGSDDPKGGISPVIDPSDLEHSTLLKAIQFDITNANRRLAMRIPGSDRLKTAGKIQTPYELTRAMWQAIKIHRPSLLFEPAYPSYVLDRADADIQREDRPAPEIPDEIITWNVIRRTPGGQNGKPFVGTREVVPRIREELVYDPRLSMDDPEEETHDGPTAIGPDHKKSRVLGMQTTGQHTDNLIQFDIWSKNNRTAEELAEYFENFMDCFRGMFLELGVLKMYFHSRIRDEVILNWKNGLVNRSLIYYFRLEKVKAIPVREIKKISVDLQVHKSLQHIDERGIEDLILDYENRIVHKWISRFGPSKV